MATDLRGLNSFKSKLEKFGNSSKKLANEIVEELTQKGVEIATQEYAGISGVAVYSEKGAAGMSKVVAEGDGIAYIEFGTGRPGERSNYDKTLLPKEPMVFESPKGQSQTTNGWEYYYDNPRTKRTSLGQEGWYHKFEGQKKATFVTGQEAGMQMYRTRQRLINESPAIIKNKLKGDDKGV